MVSIKFALVLLALVCIFHLQESSAFLVKRDTSSPSTGGAEDPFKKAMDDVQSFFNDLKDKVEKLAKETDAQGKLNQFTETVKEWSDSVQQKAQETVSDIQKSMGS